MNSFSNYKEKTASRYVPVDSGMIGSKIIESDYYLTSVKYDGFFSILEVKDGKAVLCGSDGSELTIPSVLKAAESLKTDLTVAGEICCFIDGKSATNREVKKAVADPSNYDLRFGIFDILFYGNKELPSDPAEKYEIIKKLNSGDKLFAIEQEKFTSRSDVLGFYNRVISEGSEGAVVKVPNGIIYKIKPIITLDAVILGYAETSGSEQGRLRELLLGLVTDDGGYQIVGKCGTGFSAEDRENFVKKFASMTVPSEYTEVSGAKTAFVMIRPEIAAEIRCLDILNENSKGPVTNMLLKYDQKEGYTCAGKRNAFSWVSPVFSRLREDKKPDKIQTGEYQAESYLQPVKTIKEDAQLKLSEISKKEVFVKNGKDGRSVRKFIILKTNKENNGSYPAFVVVYTDFSAKRKTPLEQDIFICGSIEEADKKISDLKEENIKKGWEAVNNG